MTTIYDFDVLTTTTEDKIYLDLRCGFGQPCVTTVNHLKNDGSKVCLNEFKHNITGLLVGNISDLKYSKIEVITTIHDVMDEREEDISLYVKLYDSETNSVDTKFIKSTKGKGAIFHSEYTVRIY